MGKVKNIMRDKKILLFLLLFIVTIVGCGKKISLPDNSIVFSTQDNGEYVSILNGDKEYVPYCAGDEEIIGECIGYYEYDNTRTYICNVEGYSTDDWKLSIDNLDNCAEYMLFREIDCKTEIEGYSSDYSWNN